MSPLINYKDLVIRISNQMTNERRPYEARTTGNGDIHAASSIGIKFVVVIRILMSIWNKTISVRGAPYIVFARPDHDSSPARGPETARLSAGLV
jgi:hypothetical protein